MKNKPPTKRLQALAERLGMTPTANLRLARTSTGWWLQGAVGGDQPLPNTQSCQTPDEVLDHMESWLAS